MMHHPTTQFSYDRAIRLWREAVIRSEDARCPHCWLRTYDCYCSALQARRSALAAHLNQNPEETESSAGHGGLRLQSCEVVMYYHYEELGRSANTGRLLEALAPASCSSFIHGDEEKERILLDDIRREQDAGMPRTCVLYPHPDAPTLSDWISARPASCGPVRLVALDGTYPQALRQMKFLRRCLEGRLLPAEPAAASATASVGLKELGVTYSLPLVRLNINKDNGDAEAGAATTKRGVTSALAGICHQPAGEKICTLQAVIMALQDCGESDRVCDALTAELNDWIAYILKRKIRLGKLKLKVVRDLSSFEPIPAMSDFIGARDSGGGKLPIIAAPGMGKKRGGWRSKRSSEAPHPKGKDVTVDSGASEQKGQHSECSREDMYVDVSKEFLSNIS